MTLKKKLIEMLVNKGMSYSQATEVIDLSIKEIDKKQGEYRITWDRPASEYPEICLSMWYHETIKQMALKWIDENKPKAWVRPMFV